MLTSEQLRAARALVRMEQKTLAEAAGISVPTVKRLEAGSGPLTTSHQNAERLRRALESAGVIFIDSNGDGPGVRLRKQPGIAEQTMAAAMGVDLEPKKD